MLQAKTAAGWPLHRPFHLYVQGGCYFITTACLHHQPLLRDPERRDWLAACMEECCRELAAERVAWVILPDHYHMVVRIEEGRVIHRLLKRLHGRSARRFNQEDATPGRQVWYSY